MSDNRVYFKNLNGVRFLAALVVIIHHIEMGKFWLGQPNIYKTSFVGGMFGQLGIILFFVLSGFLITYLLLEEHRRSGTIAIKSFYMRRILRIWPVYYLIITLSFFVFPRFDFFYLASFTEHINDAFWVKAALYFSFLPNLGYTLYEHVAYATQTWSVGVEEQFYLIWPVLMLWAINKKKILPVLVGVITFYLAIKIVAVYFYSQDMTRFTTQEFVWLFWDHFSIDCMASGGIAAYLLFYNKEKVLKILFNKYLQVALYVVLAVVTVKGWALPWFNKELYALLFTILILNLAANKNSIINLEFKPLNYLGKISYGLYMYHNIVLIVVIKLMILYNVVEVSSVAGTVVLYALSLGGTGLLSALSYEYFEKWFLSVKTRFTKVQSGNEIEEKVPAENNSTATKGIQHMPGVFSAKQSA